MLVNVLHLYKSNVSLYYFTYVNSACSGIYLLYIKIEVKRQLYLLNEEYLMNFRTYGH